ncbi:MAG: ureidoglycolate lyase [Alphaproteobacteria bacterium]|nr:ureidoglycolate lyase [Alphaproteobacteria bacterium]
MDSLNPAELSYKPSTGVQRVHETPVMAATESSLKGYGRMVTGDPRAFPVEIVPWPAQGRRPIDKNTGDQGGVTEGTFTGWWSGDTLYASNEAVNDRYLFGWSMLPERARADGPTTPRTQALLWRANYHPDGGQLFWPIKGQAFAVPLALPGDDVTPEDFITFVCDGSCGLYVHPSVWHGPILPLDDRLELLDRQGRVHARVSVDFPKEFGCYLASPLGKPGA